MLRYQHYYLKLLTWLLNLHNQYFVSVRRLLLNFTSLYEILFLYFMFSFICPVQPAHPLLLFCKVRFFWSCVASILHSYFTLSPTCTFSLLWTNIKVLVNLVLLKKKKNHRISIKFWIKLSASTYFVQKQKKMLWRCPPGRPSMVITYENV